MERAVFDFSLKHCIVYLWKKLRQTFTYNLLFLDLRIDAKPSVPVAYLKRIINYHMPIFKRV